MTPTSPTEIYSSRIIEAPVAKVYEAFANPVHLQQWWGPEGFTNTFHTFDLKPGGHWKLTMHGPEVGHYENDSVFQSIEPQKRVAWKRLSQPLFDMEVCFESISEERTRISFRMTFATEKECEKLKKFVLPKNEENFDRLERELINIVLKS
ncbi:SRPBCC family protein [Subsaxibacter sp. CAU 1640]|uniref:SRPBCC family protein n=1 Tax=Subsaxibacter sp. CAU 1640 TaxID=2933271 RepID=UPI002004A091|nr:SRPBCC family protein [Subsaxibacter sp. CAU 1640]MCK7591434.1 SRPBCC family protein [Subsaxibacter sp. CAU 1640]